MTSTVSVVLATYNGAEFIGRQLDSLATQTKPPCELIVGDDGSTDATLAIVNSFAATAAFPVTVIQNVRRLGYGGNFLSAARRATGTFVAFCDQDDIWLPTKLETGVAALEDSGADLHVHTAEVIDREDRPAGFFDQGIARRRLVEPLQLAPWGVFYGFSMMFRRQLMEVADPDDRGRHTFDFEGELSHDLWIYFLATSLGRVLLDERPLVRYRRHGGNATPEVRGRWLASLSLRLGIKAHPRLRRSDIARHRATLLQAIHEAGAAGPYGDRALVASAYWSRISRIEAVRLSVYTRQPAVVRALHCADLALRGGYRPYAKSGLGWRLLLKDVAAGVCGLQRSSPT